ncbi:MAG: hypothetical protein JO257_11565 [Deltaproteobacteria bacterium]|nr:hypothetical protein [Deltaproteobacteria bacterium]
MRRGALVGYAFAIALLYAVVAAWTPIQGDDWNHWIWSAEHPQGGFLASHFQYSDLVGFLLARCRTFHTLASPVALLAVLTGMFTIAMRRTPRATWDDLLGLALCGALIWVGQPMAGLTRFHTPYAAMYVWGAAVALWLYAPLRCGWDVPRALWPVLFVAGYATGTSTRAIATLTLAGFLLAWKKRPRWYWIALAGLVIGVAVGYARPPWTEFGRVFKRGLEPNLVLLKLPVAEAGKIISLVVALVLVERVSKVRAAGEAPIEGRGWLYAWLPTTIWCLFGPRYNEATLFPSTLVIAIGALPYLLWLATARRLRIFLVAFAAVVQLIAWPIALVHYHRLGAEGAARLAALQAAKPGTVATVRPYSQIASDFWFLGEDLSAAKLRQQVATDVFHVREILLLPAFRRLEPTPNVELALEVDGLSPAELAATAPPALWASEPAAARLQFTAYLKRLRATGKHFAARLAVQNVPWTDPRKLYVAWADANETMLPQIARTNLDENDAYSIKIYGHDLRKFHDAFVIVDDTATKLDYNHGAPRVQPLVIADYVVVVCGTERCLVADAFVPRF